MNNLLIVMASLVVIGGLSTAFAYEELGSGLLKKCATASLGLQGWSHLQGWCSVIESQQTIIAQNDEIIKQLKIANCISANPPQKDGWMSNCNDVGVEFGEWYNED